MVGSVPALGEWNPEKAVIMAKQSDDASSWSVSVALADPVNVEFKFILVNRITDAVRWELDQKPNRKIEGRPTEQMSYTWLD